MGCILSANQLLLVLLMIGMYITDITNQLSMQDLYYKEIYLYLDLEVYLYPVYIYGHKLVSLLFRWAH